MPDAANSREFWDPLFDPTTKDDDGRDYVPQLLAAIKRHGECENWSTWDNVVIAARAVEGEKQAQEALADPAWQLTEEGLLRVVDPY